MAKNETTANLLQPDTVFLETPTILPKKIINHFSYNHDMIANINFSRKLFTAKILIIEITRDLHYTHLPIKLIHRTKLLISKATTFRNSLYFSIWLYQKN